MKFPFYLLIVTIFLFTSCRVKKIEEKDLNGNILKKYGVLKKDFSKKHGAYLAYYDTGELLEKSTYKNGELDGERILYFKNGNKMTTEHYNNGMMNGEYQSFYESGAIKQKGFYKNNVIENHWYNYYEKPEGQIKEDFTIKEGYINGLYKEYATNGKLITEGNKTEVEIGLDFFDGKVTTYDSISGKSIMIFEFDKGKLIKKDSVSTNN